MSGDQGTIRAIRVICAESGLQDWPQRGAEVTKTETVFRTTDDCPRKTRNTRKAESDFLPRMSPVSGMSGDQGDIRAIRVICSESGSEGYSEPC